MVTEGWIEESANVIWLAISYSATCLATTSAMTSTMSTTMTVNTMTIRRLRRFGVAAGRRGDAADRHNRTPADSASVCGVSVGGVRTGPPRRTALPHPDCPPDTVLPCGPGSAVDS